MGKDKSVDHINQVMNDRVSNATGVSTDVEVIQQQQINLQTAFIDADAFIADPFSLLGQVIQIRKKNGKSPESLNDKGFPVEWFPFPIPAKERV